MSDDCCMCPCPCPPKEEECVEEQAAAEESELEAEDDCLGEELVEEELVESSDDNGCEEEVLLPPEDDDCFGIGEESPTDSNNIVSESEECEEDVKPELTEEFDRGGRNPCPPMPPTVCGNCKPEWMNCPPSLTMKKFEEPSEIQEGSNSDCPPENNSQQEESSLVDNCEPPVEMKEEDDCEPPVEMKEEDDCEPPVEMKEEDDCEPPVEMKEEDDCEPPVEMKEEDDCEPPAEAKQEDNCAPLVEAKEEDACEADSNVDQTIPMTDSNENCDCVCGDDAPASDNAGLFGSDNGKESGKKCLNCGMGQEGCNCNAELREHLRKCCGLGTLPKLIEKCQEIPGYKDPKCITGSSCAGGCSSDTQQKRGGEASPECAPPPSASCDTPKSAESKQDCEKDTKKDCNGVGGKFSCPPMPETDCGNCKPAWVSCPPSITVRPYTAPENDRILPLSTGGRMGGSCGSDNKCGSCGTEKSGKPKISSKCPMNRPRCPGKEEVPVESFLDKIKAMIFGKGKSGDSAQKEVFDASLVVRKDEYMCPGTVKKEESCDTKKQEPKKECASDNCFNPNFNEKSDGTPVYEGGMCQQRALNFLIKSNPRKNGIEELALDPDRKVYPEEDNNIEEKDKCESKYKGGMDLSNAKEFIWKSSMDKCKTVRIVLPVERVALSLTFHLLY